MAQELSIRPIQVKKPSFFSKTPPLREMKIITPVPTKNETGVVPEIINRPEQNNQSKITETLLPASVLQNYMGDKQISNIFVNTEGIGNLQYKLPPDTEGDVGPNHYVQMINMSMAVFNKQGELIFGPLSNETFWQGEPEPWSGNSNGDPIVLYDEQADRWLISELSFPNHPNGPYYEKIAISQTGDPTGAWYLYGYEYDYFCDYPKIGIWHDGYYMTTNNNYYDGQWHFHAVGVSVFERDSMLVGSASAKRIFFDLYPNTEPWSVLPADMDGIPPPIDEPAHLAYYKEANPDRIMLYKVETDWENTANSLLTQDVVLYPENFSGNLPDGIPQPDGAPYLSAMSNRLLYRLQYRNFGEYKAMVTNHTINTGEGIAGIRWYEFRDEGNGWNIYQQGTYSPNNTNRWLGSIAMDCFGNIALGYSVSSKGVYPSIRYTGRLKNDPLGQMTIAEQEIITGSGVQLNPNHRWGDYSSMSIDPNNPTKFWYTQEYYEISGDRSWQTRIAAFSLYDSLTLQVFSDHDTVCTGESVQLFAIPEGGIETYSFNWFSIPDGFVSTEQNPMVLPDTTTIYFCTVSDSVSFVSDHIEINVLNSPYIYGGCDTMICEGQSYMIQDAFAENYSTVHWATAGDGNFNDINSLQPEYFPGTNDISNGIVNLSVTAFPLNQCGATFDTLELTIVPCTIINESSNLHLQLFPNPSYGYLNILLDGLNNDAVSIIINDISGREIRNIYLTMILNQQKVIQIHDLEPGLYLVLVKSERNAIVQKFIINK